MIAAARLLLAVACPGLLLAALPLLQVGEEAVATISFERLDRVYEELIEDVALVDIGPAEVVLRSPEHALTVHRHEARLVARGDGNFETEVVLEVSGAGLILADIVIGSVKSQLTQELVVPRQTLELEGEVEIRRDAEGYHVRTVRLPATTRVRIESELGARLSAVCRQMALVLISLDCAAIERAVTLVDVALPAPGGEYLIPLEDTTPAERDLLDRFLRQHGAP